MISPATASAVSFLGNGVTCLALPRKQLGDVYLNGTQLPVNDEATAGWKFFGIAACQLGATLLVADKAITSKEDKKKLNMAIAGSGLAYAGMFAANGFCKDMVKPEMRIINAVQQVGVAGLALKALIDDK